MNESTESTETYDNPLLVIIALNKWELECGIEASQAIKNVGNVCNGRFIIWRNNCAIIVAKLGRKKEYLILVYINSGKIQGGGTMILKRIQEKYTRIIVALQCCLRKPEIVHFYMKNGFMPTNDFSQMTWDAPQNPIKEVNTLNASESDSASHSCEVKSKRRTEIEKLRETSITYKRKHTEHQFPENTDMQRGRTRTQTTPYAKKNLIDERHRDQ
jgi:hypothetical protein